ncbi:Leukocyte elastase inhibitor A [Holothuria leucospilota]|uniref:Leukocyte elastase inhibitor A n=1 Tax=Holothuria leucospilota TaxID=206669 RepID=A0A9Q0YD24_HOLLE|nr:Leukocyte elastase inhibitor A [Holothuria leucospilota]
MYIKIADKMASSNLSQSNQLAGALNEFSWELYKNIGKDPSSNVFFSPFSIMTALAMTFAGARGNTAEQMSEVLRFNKITDDDVHEAFERVNGAIFSSDASYTLKTANRLFSQKDYNIVEQFLKKTESNYKSGLVSVDFISAAEAARSLINGWVSEQTSGKIPDLIPPGVLNSLTRLVLVNAIYFKGNWLKQFDPKHTTTQQFKVSNSESIPVQMMFLKDPFFYYEDQSLKCQVLSLPYVGNSLSMVIVLPDPSISLTDVESKITTDVLSSWMKGSRKEKVKLLLPRFKLEESFILNDHLSKMGMSDLFHPDKADLSGVTGNKDLSVSQVIHKAFIEVNEEGTEAAAATAVVMRKRSIEIIPTFTADHPFLFLIRHNSSGSILFLGRVVRPPASKTKDEL